MTTISAEPTVGDVFDAVSIRIERRTVDDYVNATGDSTFTAHAASMKLATGLDVAPPTLFDRDMGSRLHHNRYPRSGMALHAKQEFTFIKPLLVGERYTITGTVTDVYEKNGADYFTFVAECTGSDGKVAARATKTSAFRFPGNKYTPRAGRVQANLRNHLADVGADPDARFPEVGSIVEGASLQFTRGLMNLYSGPHSGHHTDQRIAQLKGHKDSIVQGLSVTARESSMYREIFGSSWYETGSISLRYLKPIVADSVLTAIGIVSERSAGRIVFKSAVFDQEMELVTVGTVAAESRA